MTHTDYVAGRSERRLPVLTYLNIKGLAEPVRLALAVGGVEFIDRRVSHAEVAALRSAGKLPNGQVPALTLPGGGTFGQSAALLRWAGRVAGLAPEHLRLCIDAAEGIIDDIKTALVPQWYQSALPRNPLTGLPVPGAALTEEQSAAVLAALNGAFLPARLGQLEAMIASSPGGGPFVCGDTLTTVDLSLYVLATGFLDGTYCGGILPSVLDGCDAIRALVAAVGANERVAAWNGRNE